MGTNLNDSHETVVDVSPNYFSQQASKPGRTELGRGTSRFQSQSSTTEQIFNLRLFGEKHLEHQKELFHILNISIMSGMMISGKS